MAVETDYESDALLNQYLLFHYGRVEQALPWADGPAPAWDFPSRCVSELVQVDRLPPNARALDLGCAVGRSAFELSRFCGAVRAVDLSAGFIEAARTLQREGQIECRRLEEGTRSTRLVLKRPAGSHPDRITFLQGDALQPDPGWGGVDVLLMANLLDRVPEPARLLRQAASLVATGGQLILTSPFTWMKAYTPEAEWLGGAQADDARAAVRQLLQGDFDLLLEKDLPFLIREHARKYQWSVAFATVWIKT